MRDEDRETLIDHRQRLERIEHGVGEIRAILDDHGARFDRLEKKVDRLETRLAAQENVLVKQGQLLAAQGEILKGVLETLREHGEILSVLVKR